MTRWRKAHPYADKAEEQEFAFFAACIEQPVDALLGMLAVFLVETIDLTHGGVNVRGQTPSAHGRCASASPRSRHDTAPGTPMRSFGRARRRRDHGARKRAAGDRLVTGEKERGGMIAAFQKMKKAEPARTAAQTRKACKVGCRIFDHAAA